MKDKSIKEQRISKETALLALEKGCDLVNYDITYCSFSRFSSATTFCENYLNKLSNDSFTISDGGRDEHSNNYDVEIVTNKMSDLPSQSLLQRWLREVHQIEISIICFDGQYLKHVKQRPYKANTYKVDTKGLYEDVLELALVEGLNKLK